MVHLVLYAVCPASAYVPRSRTRYQNIPQSERATTVTLQVMASHPSRSCG